MRPALSRKLLARTGSERRRSGVNAENLLGFIDGVWVAKKLKGQLVAGAFLKHDFHAAKIKPLQLGHDVIFGLLNHSLLESFRRKAHLDFDHKNQQ